MAKIAFSKLGLKKNTDVKIVKWNDQEIEVKQYLPIEEKLELVTNVLNQSVDENNYYNVARLEIFKVLEMVFAYTNISFTDKQKEDIFKLYDLIMSSGLWYALCHYNYGSNVEDKCGAIPEEEWDAIDWWINDMIDNIYKYKNSALGIMQAITTDYENLNLDSENIRQNLSNPENLTLVKDVLTKLG